MINPLDALSALTQQMQLPTTAAAPAALPTGAAGGPNAVMENFNLLQPMAAPQAAAPLAPAASSGSPGTWGHMVQQMLLDVNSKQQSASQMVTDVLKGGPTPVHQAMVATEEASLSFEFLNEVRNKVVDAYQQVMQMQV